jgi:catechol 2,3-dioxygenase-like lactoylglutathione lyase family enzyme
MVIHRSRVHKQRCHGRSIRPPSRYRARVATFPGPDTAITHILVVSDVGRSRAWYLDVLGATLYREYGGTSVVLRFADAWLLLTTGGPPTDDKPGITLVAPDRPAVLDHLFTIRVDDCRAVHTELVARGAEFLTPPVTSGAETRAFFRDPDGHLFEISEYRPA